VPANPAVAVGGAFLALLLGVGIGVALESGGESSSVAGPAAPGAPNATDIGFSQDMIVHHQQAVVMAQLVRDRTKDPRIAALANGIVDDQLLDIGALRGYLALWSAPILPAGPPMTWMAPGHGHHEEGATTMPGMATAAELEELRRARGAQLDRMFLELMLRHHEGGLHMLADAGENAAVPAVRSLAARISFHQKEETRTLRALLAQSRS
jgi:uncharacterized protein (DUF305 family)